MTRANGARVFNYVLALLVFAGVDFQKSGQIKNQPFRQVLYQF